MGLRISLPFDVAIFLAAIGITALELVEAAAVGLALYGESKRPSAFFYVALGVVAVFVPMFMLGVLITIQALVKDTKRLTFAASQ
jgi:uncharacterized membrane protein